jgi:hypothetical protein
MHFGPKRVIDQTVLLERRGQAMTQCAVWQSDAVCLVDEVDAEIGLHGRVSIDADLDELSFERAAELVDESAESCRSGRPELDDLDPSHLASS